MVQSLLKILAHIYATSHDARHWAFILGQISESYRARGACLYTATRDSVRWLASETIEPLMSVFFGDGRWRSDPWLARAREKQLPGFLSEGDLLSDQERRASPLYSDVLARDHIAETVGALFPLPNGEIAVLRLFYGDEQSQPTLNDRHSLERLRPHIERSLVLSTQAGTQQAQATTNALEAMGLPAAVLDGDGRVLAVNPAMESLRPTIAVNRPSGRIAIADETAQRAFDLALSGAIEGSLERSSALPLRAPGKPPLVLHLIALPHDRRDFFPSSAAMLTAVPVGPLSAPSSAFLQALFALTPAEARVAQGLAEGKTLEDLATLLNVSRETLRTQLRSVFAKTGAKRQAELATMLASASFLLGRQPEGDEPKPDTPGTGKASDRARRKPRSPR
ncbi:helix-turn-helix transcriptional regulator [Zavarzinia aquatilis]|nr:helix-turn-helix transcriptional regulator [Zavarzinia aquatilis]